MVSVRCITKRNSQRTISWYNHSWHHSQSKHTRCEQSLFWSISIIIGIKTINKTTRCIWSFRSK